MGNADADGARCEVIWVRSNPWARPDLPALNLAEQVWPGFDAQARSCFDRLDFLTVQALHPPVGVRTGFLRVLKGEEPVTLLPFFVAHVTLDETPISYRAKVWLRRFKLPELAGWLNLPFSLIGVEQVMLGCYHAMSNRFLTRSGTAEEMLDPAIQLAVKSAVRGIRWRTGSLQYEFFNFENTPENVRVFEAWGLQILDIFPSTVVDLSAWRNGSRDRSQPGEFIAGLDRKRRAYLRKEVLPRLASGQVIVEESSLDEVRKLCDQIYRAYLNQRVASPIRWLSTSRAMFRQLIELPEVRTRVLWIQQPDGARRFAAFNLVFTHDAVRTNYWYGVDPEFRAAFEVQAGISPWYPMVYSDIVSAIEEGLACVELGPTAYFNKLHMGAELKPMLNAGKYLFNPTTLPHLNASNLNREFLYDF